MTRLVQKLIDADFCIKNPDVLHTPAQHREIISGLLEIIALRPSASYVQATAQTQAKIRAGFLKPMGFLKSKSDV
jgi:hypothetical protein